MRVLKGAQFVKEIAGNVVTKQLMLDCLEAGKKNLKQNWASWQMSTRLRHVTGKKGQGIAGTSIVKIQGCHWLEKASHTLRYLLMPILCPTLPQTFSKNELTFAPCS